jgi:hypothetical protein
VDKRERVTIAILALAGRAAACSPTGSSIWQGRSRYRAQGTSVPGVAQRTGSTLFHRDDPGRARRQPRRAGAGAQPGVGRGRRGGRLRADEDGRAILREFVSAERTTFIGSTHRIFAIGTSSTACATTALLDVINAVLVAWVRVSEGRTSASTEGVIDSQSVRTTKACGPRGYDAGKKIKGRKPKGATS